MSSSGGSRQKVRQRRHPHLFASIVRCGDCGETFWGKPYWRPGRAEPELRLIHAPRGCRRGVKSEKYLGERIAEWLGRWHIGADSRVRIARALARRRPSDNGELVRRRHLELELEQLRKQHQWGAIEDRKFLAERGRIVRDLAAIRPEADPDDRIVDEALKLASRIGEAWQAASDDVKRRFLEEWFAEIRIERDGWLRIVPRPPYREVVLEAATANEVSMVGAAGIEPATSRM